MLSQLTYKEYLKVTIPFMLSTATQPLLGAVNTAVMGHMSEAFYIAAVSLGVILFNNIYWLFGFLRVSTTSFSAQALGSESAKDKFLALARPLLIAIVISLIFLIIYPWIFKYYALLMKPESQVVELMKNYCDIIIWGAPFVLINYVTLGWLMHGADDNSLYYVYANIYECVEYRLIYRICIYHGYEYPRCSLCFFDCSNIWLYCRVYRYL